MKLLFYTEKLTEKIMFYDKIAKQSLKNMCSNPFFRRQTFTIAWVEEERK